MKNLTLVIAMLLISFSPVLAGDKYPCKQIGKSKIKKTRFKATKPAKKAKDIYNVVIYKNGQPIHTSNEMAFTHSL
jgi:hypothetical protein